MLEVRIASELVADILTYNNVINIKVIEGLPKGSHLIKVEYNKTKKDVILLFNEPNETGKIKEFRPIFQNMSER